MRSYLTTQIFFLRIFFQIQSLSALMSGIQLNNVGVE